MTNLSGPNWGPANRSKPAQLVVLCHGLGADGSDLIGLAPYMGKALPDAVFVSPDAPELCDMGPTGRQWFSLSDRDPAKLAVGVARAAGALNAYIDAQLAKYDLPLDAYALVGFSQGAMTVLFTGLRREIAPRAIIACAGALIAPEALALEKRNQAPVLLIHGESDDVVPAEMSRRAEIVLKHAGVPVKTLFIPGLYHNIDEAGMAAGAAFLQEQFDETVK